MPATTKTPLGASTTNRKYYLDVNSTPDGAPTWLPVCGVMEFQDAHDLTLRDDSDFDSDGYQSQTKTAEAWSVVVKLARKVTAADATVYDPGQELLRAKGIGHMGPSNSVAIRYYEMEEDGPREEAYAGTAAVQWSPDGGDMTALSTVTCTLTGQGRLVAIAHPDA